MNYHSILILLRQLSLWVLTIISFIRNPCRQLPKIYHEFPKQSLRYKLNVVLNETDSNLISKAETISLYQFKLLIKSNMINKYNDTCEESNCYVCNL